MTLEISGIVLGSPYINDRKAAFYRDDNKYHLFKDGIEYIIRAHDKNTCFSLIHAGEMKLIMNASHNLTLLMIKHRDVLNQTFQKYALNEQVDFIKVSYACNEMFQESNRFPLKGGEEYVKHLQQSTSVLSSVGNKILVQESEKVKEKATKQLEKGGMGSTNACLWFPKGTWQWQRYLVKSQRKYKAKATKNRHGSSVQGETVFNFPLINYQGRNKMVSARITCYSANSWEL